MRKVVALLALVATIAALAAAAEAGRDQAPRPHPVQPTAADAPRSGGHWGLWVFGFGR
ncbi:MAG TPA: hypothetical protein VI408_16665 [Gaiellaceae bacterium]